MLRADIWLCRLWPEKPTGRVPIPGPDGMWLATHQPVSVLFRQASEGTNGEARPRQRWIGNERALQCGRSEPDGSTATGG